MRTFRADKFLVACLCAAALGASGSARAAEPPEGEGEAAGEATDELSDQAMGHVSKAVEHYNSQRYTDAEEEFKRAAYFAPKWRPLHFNLGVLAEAQGKLGTAVTEYKSFRPYGSPDEQMLVDQRIDELTGRKARIARAFKRQIAMSATAMTLGLGSLAGGVVLFVFIGRRKAEARELDEAAMEIENTMGGLGNEQSAAYRTQADSKEKQAQTYLYGGIYLALFGLLAAAYSFLPLTKAIRSKRQLDGLALGGARLHWAGLGAQLRF